MTEYKCEYAGITIMLIGLPPLCSKRIFCYKENCPYKIDFPKDVEELK